VQSSACDCCTQVASIGPDYADYASRVTANSVTGATIEFIAYCEKALSEEAILAILADPDNATLPANLGDQYALISYVTSAARDAKILDAAAGIVLRLKPELGVLLLRNLLQKQPKFATHKKIIEFIKAHKELIF
jgi:hypothetical protein